MFDRCLVFKGCVDVGTVALAFASECASNFIDIASQKSTHQLY